MGEFGVFLVCFSIFLAVFSCFSYFFVIFGFPGGIDSSRCLKEPVFSRGKMGSVWTFLQGKRAVFGVFWRKSGIFEVFFG